MANEKVIGYHNGQMGEFDPEEVDYELADHSRIFGSHINAIPIQSAVQGPRLFYGARFYNQAMPIQNREAPLVQSLDVSQGPESATSFDEVLGKYAGAVRADEDAEVVDVTPDEVTLRTIDGRKLKKQLYNNFPFNRKSSITNNLLVQKGQQVKAGDLIASSNYTDDKGALALGTNVRVGVVPYKGFSMDDATVISQSLAEKLKSEHTETYEQKYDRDVKAGLNHFRAVFPTRFKKDQLERLNEKGVVRPGVVLKQGDPMILATRPRVISSAGVNVGKLTKTLSQARTDSSQVWEHDYDGEVLDVVETSKGVKIVTRGYAPTKLGDKVTCFDTTTEILTTEGWRNVKDIEIGDVCYTLDDNLNVVESGVIATQQLDYEGPMVLLETSDTSVFVTADHNLFVKFYESETWELLRAETCLWKNFYVRHWDYDELITPTDQAEVEFSGKVYCLTLAEHNKVYTRRNGKTTWVGQCRSGQKSIVSKIIPDELMPRTKDGKPLELLLNPLSIPSRTNNSLLFEIMLGKVADAQGKPIKIPGFTKPGEKWYELVKNKLDEAGLSDTEEIFDPEENRFLENPALVGKAYLMKLHHVAESKASSRGQGGYDAWQSPSKGPSEGGGAKRLSGLETTVLLSSGAYNNLREGSTLRGQQQDEYWRAIRSGITPKKPGVPFAFDKTMTMMFGAGINPRKMGKGVIRLAPTTDKDLEEKKPVEIKKGELLNLANMSPVPGGLFDPSLVGNNGWGAISLPFRVPNPAFEDSIRTLLGLRKKDLEDIMAGRMELPEHLR